jgi:hypothetical protein
MNRLRRPLAGAALGTLLLAACSEGIVVAPCDPAGVGDLVVNITGLPAGIVGSVLVEGPGGSFGVTTSSTIAGILGGSYTITPSLVYKDDSLVHTAYRGVPSATVACVRDTETKTVHVPHSVVATSGKAWVGAGFYSLGFTSTQLNTTATMAPTVMSGTRGGVGATFDTQGNLWVRGQTAGDPYLMRYSALALSGTGTPIADRTINLQGVTCEGSSGLAFDEAGNLWVSIGCQGKVVRLTPAQLSLSGTVLPTLQISNLSRPEGLAFDAAGNLWVADDTHLRRFDAARLVANISTAADLRATFTTPVPPAPGADELSVNNLAFDLTGALWVSTYDQKALYRVEAAIAVATGVEDNEVTRIIYMNSFATPRAFAFDNNGGVLIGGSTSTFARFAPSQLASSVLLPSTATPERVFTSASILGFVDAVAIFPAPATSPLYSRRR